MLTRRLIRIKVFQSLYGETLSTISGSQLHPIVNKLKKSSVGFYQTFQSVLAFPLVCKQFMENHLNPKEEKYIVDELSVKTYESIANNPIIKDLENQNLVIEYFNNPSINWLDYDGFIREAYQSFIKSKIGNSIDILNPNWPFFFQTIKAFFDYLMIDNPNFDQIMEGERMQWYDEKLAIDLMLQNVLKTYKTEKGQFQLKIKKDHVLRDQNLGIDLLEKTIVHYDEIQDIIDEQTTKWELERMAKVDRILMTMALVEMLHFPDIPVKVSINEYIDIAKAYSTKDSGKFVNGILDKIKKEFVEADKLNKSGRGLL